MAMTKTKPKPKPFAALAAIAAKKPERVARIDEDTRAIGDALALAELRSDQGVTQHDVAARLNVSQANVSRIEHEDDVYLSTLRRYVSALGGELEIHAVFPERRIALIGSQR